MGNYLKRTTKTKRKKRGGQKQQKYQWKGLGLSPEISKSRKGPQNISSPALGIFASGM